MKFMMSCNLLLRAVLWLEEHYGREMVAGPCCLHRSLAERSNNEGN